MSPRSEVREHLLVLAAALDGARDHALNAPDDTPAARGWLADLERRHGDISEAFANLRALLHEPRPTSAPAEKG